MEHILVALFFFYFNVKAIFFSVLQYSCVIQWVSIFKRETPMNFSFVVVERCDYRLNTRRKWETRVYPFRCDITTKCTSTETWKHKGNTIVLYNSWILKPGTYPKKPSIASYISSELNDFNNILFFATRVTIFKGIVQHSRKYTYLWVRWD